MVDAFEKNREEAKVIPYRLPVELVPSPSPLTVSATREQTYGYTPWSRKSALASIRLLSVDVKCAYLFGKPTGNDCRGPRQQAPLEWKQIYIVNIFTMWIDYLNRILLNFDCRAR